MSVDRERRKKNEERLAHLEEALEKLRELRKSKTEEYRPEKEKLRLHEIKERAGYIRGLSEALNLFEYKK